MSVKMDSWHEQIENQIPYGCGWVSVGLNEIQRWENGNYHFGEICVDLCTHVSLQYEYGTHCIPPVDSVWEYTVQ